MADRSLFSRLSKLFSTDVVIRNVGGNQLKVADINQIQTTGKYEVSLGDTPLILLACDIEVG